MTLNQCIAASASGCAPTYDVCFGSLSVAGYAPGAQLGLLPPLPSSLSAGVQSHLEALSAGTTALC